MATTHTPGGAGRAPRQWKRLSSPIRSNPSAGGQRIRSAPTNPGKESQEDRGPDPAQA